jgi:hypothetical protein
MWEVSQEPSFRSMLDSPAMKIMHDEFDAYIRHLAKLPSPPVAG